jgi:hypothetical protein
VMSNKHAHTGNERLDCGCKLPVLATVSSQGNDCRELINKIRRSAVSMARVNDKPVQCLQDTGATLDLVRGDLVTPDQDTGKTVLCVLIDGVCKSFPVARIKVESEWRNGYYEAACVDNLIYPLILGNSAVELTEPVSNRLSVIEEEDENVEEIDGDKIDEIEDNGSVDRDNTLENGEISDDRVDEVTVAAVQTRGMKIQQERLPEPLTVPKITPLKVTVDQFLEMQKNDLELAAYWELAEQNKPELKGKATFTQRNGLLYRKFKPKSDEDEIMMQLLVPQSLRETVIECAHNSQLGTQLGVNKTVLHVASEFWRKGISDHTKRFCWSCDLCQKCTKRGGVAKAPLQKMQIVGQAFNFVYVDLVGPLELTENSSRWILSICDAATHFPECVALKSCDSISVVKHCLGYSRTLG